MKVKGRHINFNKTAPTKVSDMKQGEWRLGENGLYGRVGNQILAKGYPGWAEIHDEFNDQSIDPKWEFSDSGGASHEEASDGTMTFIFGGGGSQTSVDCYQDPVGEVSEVIPAGLPWGMQVRFHLGPHLYTANQTSYGANIYHFSGFQWGLWDDSIYWIFDAFWLYGGHPSGYDMYGFESCYLFGCDISDEYNAEYCYWGPSELIASGRADYVSPVPVDETHNGWFTFRFTKSGSGVLKMEVQPDGDSSWYDVTVPGLVAYNLNIGGKGSYAWGFDVYGREVNDAGYAGASQGPTKVDWVRP